MVSHLSLTHRAVASTVLMVPPPDASAADDAQTPSPALSVSSNDLSRAVRCHEPTIQGSARVRQPVLLVPGTTATGAEQWDWGYVPALRRAGFPVCTVDLHERGLGDMQVSAEYVVHAIRYMKRTFHSKIDVLGYSQGGILARWAVKFWPDVRRAVDDVVLLEVPVNRGTLMGNVLCAVPCIPVAKQVRAGSAFFRALNRGGEAPGAVDYTSILSKTDEVVIPQGQRSVSLFLGEAPNLSNVEIQSICPGRVVDHMLAPSDAVGYAIALDAFAHPGPADQARISHSACRVIGLPGTTPLQVVANTARFTLRAGPMLAGVGYPTVVHEPALRAYAR